MNTDHRTSPLCQDFENKEKITIGYGVKVTSVFFTSFISNYYRITFSIEEIVGHIFLSTQQCSIVWPMRYRKFWNAIIQYLWLINKIINNSSKNSWRSRNMLPVRYASTNMYLVWLEVYNYIHSEYLLKFNKSMQSHYRIK